MSHSASGRVKSDKDKQTTNGYQGNNKENKKEEFSSSDDDDDDEPIYAPIQLKIEVGKLIKSNLIFIFQLVCQFDYVSSMDISEKIMSFYVNV
jgi:hypothetical protein